VQSFPARQEKGKSLRMADEIVSPKFAWKCRLQAHAMVVDRLANHLIDFRVQRLRHIGSCLSIRRNLDHPISKDRNENSPMTQRRA
jgi:hypothetical protein